MTAVPLDSTTVEEHLSTLLEKLEALREAREATAALGRRYRPPAQTEVRTLEFWRAIFAECIAAFFLVFLVSAAGVKTDGFAENPVLTTALACGMIMAVLIHCFGKISGGHVNPAVTLGYMVAKKISPLRAIMFILAQCGGGIGGAALLYGVAPVTPITSLLHLGPWERFGIELVLTFIVAFTQISVADRKLFNNSPVIVGAAYTACSLVPGAVLNPSRALGPAFVMNKQWESHWVFWFGPALGGVTAALIFEFIFNAKHHKRPKESIDGDSSSIHSEDERYDDGKYHPAAYRPVAPNVASPGGMYCASEASASRYSSPPGKMERGESIYGGKMRKAPEEAIYSGTRSLYNAKIDTKSPPLTRANLNRSQSVYAKSQQGPRDILPRAGPLVPAQSMYPLKLGGQFTANIREFASPDVNFIAGIKTEDGGYLKVGNGMNPGAAAFLANRTASKSYHDITDQDKPNIVHATNQNLQNQLLGGKEKENVYGLRGSPPGGVYPSTEPPRQPVMNRTAAYVKSVQNHKPRDSNYDIVPNGVREVQGFQKALNRSETSDYGSNRSDASSNQRPEKPEGQVERSDLPPPPPANHPMPMRLIHNKMGDGMGWSQQQQPMRHSPLSSVSSSYSRSSPNPPYPPPPPQQ